MKGLKEEEREVWKNKFKSLTSVVVSKTKGVLLKTLKEHDQYTKRSKDLMDEEIAEMRRELDSLKPIPQSDTIKPERVFVAAPASFGSHMPPLDESKCWSNSNPHVNGNGNYKWIIDHNGQPIYVPSIILKELIWQLMVMVLKSIKDKLLSISIWRVQTNFEKYEQNTRLGWRTVW